MKKLILFLFIVSVCQGHVVDKPIMGIPIDASNDLSRGIVGEWTFMDRPGVVGRTYDLSGNGNHGTLTGDTHSVPGRFGNALNFDGSDSVNCGDVLNIAPENMTWIVWVQVTSDADTFDDIILGRVDGSASAADSWYLGKRRGNHGSDANKLVWWMHDGGASIMCVSDGVITDSGWHQVAVVVDWDVSLATVYVDGIPQADTESLAGLTAASMSNTEDFIIGWDDDSIAGQGWHDDIGSISGYSRALTPGDITSLYSDPFQIFEQERLPIASAAAPAEVGQFIMIMSSLPCWLVPGLILTLALLYRRKTA